MKKGIVFFVIVAIFLIIGIVSMMIMSSNDKKEKYVTCVAGEEISEGLSTKVITEYHYNERGLIVTSVDYTIEITSEKDYSQLTTSKTFYENTICNTANLPENVTCRMELTDTQLKVITHEDIKDNQSTVLQIGDLSKFTYDSFEDRKEEGVVCKLN